MGQESVIPVKPWLIIQMIAVNAATVLVMPALLGWRPEPLATLIVNAGTGPVIPVLLGMKHIVTAVPIVSVVMAPVNQLKESILSTLGPARQTAVVEMVFVIVVKTSPIALPIAIAGVEPAIPPLPIMKHPPTAPKIAMVR